MSFKMFGVLLDQKVNHLVLSFYISCRLSLYGAVGSSLSCADKVESEVFLY